MLFTTLNKMDLNTILNFILDPYSSYNKSLSNIENIPLNKDLSKYYKYINEHMHKSNKLTQLRILNQFCYSINYFHVLLQHDLFPYDDFNNLYKILIADKMKQMYKTYYNLIFHVPAILSINTLKLYYICLSLKRKINKYKLCGKLAWEEILQCPIEKLNMILYSYNKYELIDYSDILINQKKLINSTDINILIIINYHIFINNQLYLQQLINYIVNNFNYIISYINDYISLLYLNNVLYNNKIFNTEFELLLYNYIMKKINKEDIIDTLKNILSISSSNTYIYQKFNNYYQSHILLNKI